MTGYTLFGCKGTGSFGPRVVLELARAPYTFHAVDLTNGEQHTPAFRAINPHGKVPALRMPDGSILTESAAMMLHLGERFPDCGLLPPEASAERAQVQRWLVFMSANIYESCLRVVYPDRFTTDQASAAGVATAARMALAEQWGMIEAALHFGPFLIGAQHTVADIYMLMLAPWVELTRALPNVQRAVAALIADPVIAPLWADHIEE